MKNLALQIGEINRVVINQRDFANASRSEIKRGGRAKATGANNQRVSGKYTFLAFNAQCVEQDVPAITEKLLVRHLYSRHSGGVSS
jgi:hypothetical protein